MPRTVRSARAFVSTSIAAAGVALVTTLGAQQGSTIRSDETVAFFPAFAVEGTSSWTAHVHGWIFEDEKGAVRDELAREFGDQVRQRFGLTTQAIEGDAADAVRRFGERMAPFLVDNERNKQLAVTAAGVIALMGKSEKNGHFAGTLSLPAAAGRGGEWVGVRAVVRPGDARVFDGKVQLVPRSGFTVVSDIDDTIKHSQVTDKIQLGLNTFVRDFRATEGMAALYQRWAQSGQAVFHYVSGSPYQLYGFLADFAKDAGFPAGSYHLRKFRVKDRSIVEFFGDPETFKLETIAPILEQFRDRRFVLVGDSGERDPEVYTKLAMRFANVDAIFIRDVTNETLDTPRYRALFADVPARVQRRVFKDTRELDDVKLPPVTRPAEP